MNRGLCAPFWTVKKPKVKIKKVGLDWVIISPCGNFKEYYSSWSSVIYRLGELK